MAAIERFHGLWPKQKAPLTHTSQNNPSTTSMGKKSKRSAAREKQAARQEEEQPRHRASEEEATMFDAEDWRIVKAMQGCMPAMADSTAEKVMVALINEDAYYPERTQNEIVRIFEDDGHQDGNAMKDAVYEYLENGGVHDAVCAELDSVHDGAPSQEKVLVTTWKSRGQKALGQKAHGKDMGQKAKGQEASQTLGLAISSKVRQPKPRKMGSIDELVWSEAQEKAVNEIQTEFKIEVPLDDYYGMMCSVGKQLLADAVNRKTQKIYDYKATKLFQKTERKLMKN